jgi:hypothetical protein
MSGPEGSPSLARLASFSLSLSRIGLKNRAPARIRIRSLPHSALPPHTVWMGKELFRSALRIEVVRFVSYVSELP